MGKEKLQGPSFLPQWCLTIKCTPRVLPDTGGAEPDPPAPYGWTRALAQPHTARLDFLMSKVGREGLLRELFLLLSPH